MDFIGGPEGIRTLDLFHAMEAAVKTLRSCQTETKDLNAPEVGCCVAIDVVSPTPLKRFQNNQRVRVIAEHTLFGKAGTVVRLRRADDQAWVEMDKDLPPALQVFPKDDTRRDKHTLLWPDECEAIS